MKQHENDKVVAAVPAGVVATSETATLTIDTRGYDHASVTVMRAANANTVFASVLRVQESDDDSSYTNVTALVAGGVGGFTMPTVANTVNPSVVKMDIDTRSKKRYLKVSVTPTTAVNMAVSARLSRAETSPTNASEAGAVAWVAG